MAPRRFRGERRVRFSDDVEVVEVSPRGPRASELCSSLSALERALGVDAVVGADGVASPRRRGPGARCSPLAKDRAVGIFGVSDVVEATDVGSPGRRGPKARPSPPAKGVAVGIVGVSDAVEIIETTPPPTRRGPSASAPPPLVAIGGAVGIVPDLAKVADMTPRGRRRPWATPLAGDHPDGAAGVAGDGRRRRARVTALEILVTL